jgi:hypothetical protein
MPWSTQDRVRHYEATEKVLRLVVEQRMSVDTALSVVAKEMGSTCTVKILRSWVAKADYDLAALTSDLDFWNEVALELISRDEARIRAEMVRAAQDGNANLARQLAITSGILLQKVDELRRSHARAN